ncbi:type-F conjugative transfer system secretin TraK [Scandinavium goeteborgense]|uniref:Conjugal transfer pilus assembly protein TraK n=1 Tax=Scandinavium goeteborgense TaxID=1851514 RepID=A0A4R6E365_SCAGO|nr:type-F conjugative transfer system secretin TraK [Scandinavium goeteborgense]TDN51499.1 conjugal transfer pilus assembly protein TraK [Scandinavium goeteborgense]
MKNKLLAGALFLVPSLIPFSAGATLHPVTLNFVQGSQFTLAVSSTNPNLFFIPGDRITAISGPAGAMTGKRQTESGGVIFSTTRKKPFTLYLETEQGKTLSVAATPAAGQGRVYQLVNNEPVATGARPDNGDRASPYESLLVAANRAASTGTAPDGYGRVAPLSRPFNLPAGLQLTGSDAWANGQLRIDVYRVENMASYGLALKEQHFWVPGVRSVMFDTQARALMPRTTMRVFVVRALAEVN